MSTTLDPTDLKILELLQINARLTNREIGDRIYKSASTVSERIRRLQENGTISKFVAVLNHEQIERGLMAFTHVQLRDHSKESLIHFEREIVKFQEVLECYHMSGQYDFILRVAVKDLSAYHDFLMNDLFETIPLGSVQSTFVMKEAKSKTAFPIVGKNNN